MTEATKYLEIPGIEKMFSTMNDPVIMGEECPFDDDPYFWSDQFDLRLQHVGHAEAWHAVELDGDAESFSARYLDRDGRLLAALLANRPREVGGLRRELAEAA